MVTSTEGGSRRSGVVQWVRLSGDRTAVTGSFVAVVYLVTYALIRWGVLAIGSSSSLPSMLGSGGLAGLVTLLTVTLSINQLTLSRLFGSPGELEDDLEGTIAFRRTVEELSGEHPSPNDPAEFLSLVAETLVDRAAALDEELSENEELASVGSDSGSGEGLGEGAEEIRAFTDTVSDYADRLAVLDDGDATVDVLASILGPAYADNLAVAHGLQHRYDDHLSASAGEQLDAVVELLEAIAITRQFFKTLVVQQDLARLSRRLIYSGLVAVLAVVYLTLAYTSSAVTIPAVYLPWIVAAVIALLVTPLAQIASTLLRIATVTMYSVSAGPFVPPEERPAEH